MVPVLLGGSAFALYAQTLAPTVLAGDGGEFQFAPYLLGVAHPTGYPLYLLLGWAWSHLLPVGDVAYRMNLFSAFWAAMAVGLLYPTVRALLRQAIPDLRPASQRLIAILAAAFFAVTPTFWSQSVIAEVYPFHIFLVVLLFYLLLSWGERRDARFLPLSACCFGLGLAHHRTTVLLAAACLAYVWLVERRSLANRRLILQSLVLLLLPLSLYLYIPWRTPHTPYLHLPLAAGRELVLYQDTLRGFLSFILGGPFGGSLDFSVDLGARVAMAGGFLRAELGWIGMALAVLGLVSLVISRRWAPLALTGLAFVATLAFDLVYTIGDIIVLFIPAFLIAVLWLAVGVGAVAQSMARVTRLPAFTRGILVLPFLALPLWTAIGHYAGVDQSHNGRARMRWEAILAEPLPTDAVLVSNDRNDMMPMWYFQYVGDRHPRRPDLLGLFPLITPQYPTIGPVLDLALSTGRPVYLIKEMPGIEVKVDVKAEDGLWRVLGQAAQEGPENPRDDRLADAIALAGYDRSPRSPRAGETLHISLYWQALRPLEAEYHTYVHLVDAQGQKVAQSDLQPGGVYYPTTLWQPGERLRDDHLLAVPANAEPGVYRLLAGMYALAADDTIESLGEPIQLADVGINMH